MAGLADDWQENRQTCVDVLCAYLRLPYEPAPGEAALVPEQLAFRANREVRHTVIRVVTAHLKEEAAVSWQGLNFDFTGVAFDGGDFSGAVFSGGTIDFSNAVFADGTVVFAGARFSGGTVYFAGARFSGGTVYFGHAVFSGSTVNFRVAVFSGGLVYFERAVFSGGTVSFDSAVFSGGLISFGFAVFSGSTVQFVFAEFSGGQINFSLAADWSHPPLFTWNGAPPSGVKLPPQRSVSPPDSTSGSADSPPPTRS